MKLEVKYVLTVQEQTFEITGDEAKALLTILQNIFTPTVVQFNKPMGSTVSQGVLYKGVTY